MTTILKVTVTELNRKAAPFRYTAHLADGTTEVIRNATRLYANAFQFERPVCSGPSGLSSFFVFGKAHNIKTVPLVATFPIERTEARQPKTGDQEVADAQATGVTADRRRYDAV